MAILSGNQLSEVRQALVKDLGSANFTKPQINSAIQAVEDVLTSTTLRSNINNAIDTATSPLVLEAEQKRLLVKYVLWSRFLRGNN